MKIICFIKTILRTAGRPAFWLDLIHISGHDYAEQEDGSLKCKICGDKSQLK